MNDRLRPTDAVRQNRVMKNEKRNNARALDQLLKRLKAKLRRKATLERVLGEDAELSPREIQWILRGPRRRRGDSGKKPR